MLYINIEPTFNTHQFNIEKSAIFDIIPTRELFEINSFIRFSKYYTGDDFDTHKRIKSKLRENLVEWELLNTNAFDASALNFTQQHIIDHFVLQYTSIHTIALNVFKDYDKVTILCPDNINLVKYDWCSPIISLMALLDAAQLSRVEVFFIEETIGCLQPAICENLDFEVNKVFGNLKNYERLASTAASLSNHENIKYALSNRNVLCIKEKYKDYITVQPHELSFEIEKIGVFNFLHDKACELKKKWIPIISIHPIAKILETNFFESYFKTIINQLIDFESMLFQAFTMNARTKNLILEELTDIYALPLVSAAKRAGINITMFQHSSNAILDHIYYIRDSTKVYLPNEIWANSNYTYALYKNLSPHLNVRKLIEGYNTIPIAQREYYSDAVLIIENDFFRYFGVPINVNKVLSDLVTCVTLLTKLGVRKFIWRQRSQTFNPIYEMLCFMVSEAEITMHNSGNASEVFDRCFSAIGVGSNSSLAIDFINSGGTYHFVGSRVQELEYATIPETILRNSDIFGVPDEIARIHASKDDFLKFQKFQSDEIGRN